MLANEKLLSIITTSIDTIAQDLKVYIRKIITYNFFDHDFVCRPHIFLISSVAKYCYKNLQY